MNNLRTSPAKFLQKPSPPIFHGAFAPSFIWRRRPCVNLSVSQLINFLDFKRVCPLAKYVSENFHQSLTADVCILSVVGVF